MTILIADCTEEILFKFKDKYNLILNIIGLFLGFYGLILSGRRTMIVAVGLYYLYLFIKVLKSNRKKAIILLITGVISISGVMSIAFKNEKYRVKELVLSITNIKTDQSNIQRLLMWRRGYYVAKENPMLGIGVDGFYKEIIKEKYNSIKKEGERFEEVFIHVHNEYIHPVISRGVPGAILFYGLWIYILNRLRKSKDKDFDIMLLIIYGIYGIFDPYSIRAEAIIFYSFIGISFVNCLPVDETKNRCLEKLGFVSLMAIFLIALYFNKRFRYYFLILLVVYLGYCFYNKRKREKYEKI